MAGLTLTQRMAALEKQVKSLIDQVEGSRGKDWRRTIGAFSGDEFIREVFAEGKKLREAERTESPGLDCGHTKKDRQKNC